MAGGGNQEDNPVAINVVAMVDIIFCLCLFFMCSLKFKPLDAKFDSYLPKEVGVKPDDDREARDRRDPGPDVVEHGSEQARAPVRTEPLRHGRGGRREAQDS